MTRSKSVTAASGAKMLAKVKISYDTSYYMSVEDGVTFMEVISRSEKARGYSPDKMEYQLGDSEVRLSIVTEQSLKEQKLANVIEANNE